MLYLGSWDAVSAAAGRVPDATVSPANPYWAEHGVTLADPDGFRIVLAASVWTWG